MIRLVDRDFEIFNMLKLFGCLNTSQIVKYFDLNIKVMQRRLRKLSSVGYLRSLPIPSTKPGRSQNLYYLGQKASELVETNDYKPRLNYRLSHQLQNSDILLEIVHSLKETDLKYKVLPEHSIRATYHDTEIIPDCAFTISREEKHALFYIENCAGTEILSSPTLNNDIESKFIKYVEIFKSSEIGYYENFFENSFNRFRLLFIANSYQRMQAISELVKEHDCHGFIWLTHLTEFQKKGVLGNIWQIPALGKFNLSIVE